jgi:RHS repeat-associated protein
VIRFHLGDRVRLRGWLPPRAHDTATGLYHLRARQYDPVIGQFLATDPVAPDLLDPYVSAYVYVNNRPTVLVDQAAKAPSSLRVLSGRVSEHLPEGLPTAPKSHSPTRALACAGWEGQWSVEE